MPVLGVTQPLTSKSWCSVSGVRLVLRRNGASLHDTPAKGTTRPCGIRGVAGRVYARVLQSPVGPRAVDADGATPVDSGDLLRECAGGGWGLMRSGGFPGDHPVTVSVCCGVDQSCLAEHAVTIGPAMGPDAAWSVDTGHDLEAERVAAALGGGRITCLDIAEFEVPAIEGYWRSLRRDVLVGIEPDRARHGKTAAWVVATPVKGCACESGRWDRPEEAAAHVRDLGHWCRRHGAQYRSTQRLLRLLQQATGPAVWSDRWPLSSSSRCVEHDDDLFRLWESGIHPSVVNELHSGLELADPLNARAYLHIVTKQIDLGWLRRFASGGPQAVVWAATTWTMQDAAHPDARVEWFEAGLHYKVITALLGSPYSLGDVRTLASATGLSMNAAGHVITDWLATGCRPSLEQLIRVCRLVPGGRQAPTAPAIKVVMERTEHHRDGMTATDVGLVLVAVGTPTGAAALIRRGIRSLDDVENENR